VYSYYLAGSGNSGWYGVPETYGEEERVIRLMNIERSDKIAMRPQHLFGYYPKRSNLLFRFVSGFILLSLILSYPTCALGEDVVPRTTSIVPDSALGASGIYRFFFGDGYRDLWTTAIELEYLDLNSFAGGLTPTGTGGGMQSLGLRFIGADGRPYSFRPLKKSLQELIPDYMRSTFVEDMVQDQVKSAMPTAPPVVPVLLDAVDVLHNLPRLIIIPDDSSLGEYREHFANAVGTIEEWPNDGKGNSPGFAGATEVVSTDELFEILQSDPREHIDARNYLTARLMDLLIGDWDRHKGQWRWANVGEGVPPAWRPIPEDRDQAFARYDGLLLGMGRTVAPQLTNFGPKYESILGMTWNGRNVDRRLLVGLSRAEWDSIAVSVKSRITDDVIEQAFRQLPRSHYELRGEEMVATLKQRRDMLPDIAQKYYRHLAGEVDLHMTDRVDKVELTREEDGSLNLLAYPAESEGASSGSIYQRRFNPDHTGDVRLYLYGGDDQVMVKGEGPDRISMRVICTDGNDTVHDSSKGHATKVYDSRTQNGVVVHGAKVDRRPYKPPKPDKFALPPRDWGNRRLWSGKFDINGDLGLLLGVGIVFDRYGFRRDPFVWQMRTGLAYSTRLNAFRFDIGATRQRENSRNFISIDALISGVETVNFFGFGNESPFPEDEDAGLVNRKVARLTPAWGTRITPQWTFRLEIPMEYSITKEQAGTIVTESGVYGAGEFWLAGLMANIELDSRDNTGWPTRGLNMELKGSYYPEWLDLEAGAYGAAEGLIKGFYSVSKRLTFAGRLGGRRVWGSYPYWEAAFIGGNETVRGYESERFAGDGSIYAGLEARVPVLKGFVILPWEWGVFLLADAGRVFLSNESSKKVHAGYGFGIWGAPLIRQFTMSLALAFSEEDTRIYFTFGLG
jgi:hypothetical protein